VEYANRKNSEDKRKRGRVFPPCPCPQWTWSQQGRMMIRPYRIPHGLKPILQDLTIWQPPLDALSEPRRTRRARRGESWNDGNPLNPISSYPSWSSWFQSGTACEVRPTAEPLAGSAWDTTCIILRCFSSSGQVRDNCRDYVEISQRKASTFCAFSRIVIIFLFLMA
jgi:hypothetical protein